MPANVQNAGRISGWVGKEIRAVPPWEDALKATYPMLSMIALPAVEESLKFNWPN